MNLFKDYYSSTKLLQLHMQQSALHNEATTDAPTKLQGLPNLQPINTFEFNAGAPAKLYLDFMNAIQSLRADPRKYWQKQLPRSAMSQVEYVWGLMYSKTYELSRLRWHIQPNGIKHFCIYADKPPSEKNTEGEYLEFNIDSSSADKYDYAVTLGGFSVKQDTKGNLVTFQIPMLRFYIDSNSGFIAKIIFFESDGKKHVFEDSLSEAIQ